MILPTYAPSLGDTALPSTLDRLGSSEFFPLELKVSLKCPATSMDNSSVDSLSNIVAIVRDSLGVQRADCENERNYSSQAQDQPFCFTLRLGPNL